jgi:DNA helicase-4
VTQLKLRSIWLTFQRGRREKRDRRRFAHGFATWLPIALTDSQISAVVSYAPETLVVAGAGSGKTTLLLARAKYLVESNRSHPDRILALAFNRAAALELEDRAMATGVPMKAMTFHRFGNELLNKNGRLGGVAFAEGQVIQKFFADHVLESLNSDHGDHLIRFFSEMLVPFRDHAEFETLEDYSAYARAIPRTLANERVKSHGELIIANYLFRRGVEYGYEAIYKGSNRGVWHRPDFTVQVRDGEAIYVEYFGIDKEGNTAPYVDRDTYLKEIEWKRETHAQHGTTLVELTYQDLRDGILAQKLEKALDGLGVPQLWRTSVELADAASQVGYTTRFVKLCTSFLAHVRARRLNSQTLKSLRALDRRSKAFLEIFSEYLSDYEAELLHLGLPDYSEMIHGAVEMLINHSIAFPYDHVLVDEYQDISADRQGLLAAMKVANPLTEFMYVGDDWQSINRFAGADISIMQRASRLTLVKKTMRLAETHRFPQSLADISSEFVQKNPSQLKKAIVSTNPSTARKALFIHTDTQARDNIDNLRRVINSIDGGNNGEASLLVVARYNNSLPSSPQVAELWRGPYDVQSIHRSKGSEADYVVVMDVIQDLRGFPSTIEDDPILSLVLSEPESYKYAEERRLFYVALTRARVECHLIAPIEEPSLFVVELIKAKTGTIVGPMEIEIFRCPVCTTGVLTRPAWDKGSHCSNEPPCEFRSPWCPDCNQRLYVISKAPLKFECPNHIEKPFSTCSICGWGILIEREGPYGKFPACSNYSTIGCKGRETARLSPSSQ